VRSDESVAPLRGEPVPRSGRKGVGLSGTELRAQGKKVSNETMLLEGMN